LVKGELDDELEAHLRTESDHGVERERFHEVLGHSRDILFKRDIRTGGYEYVSDAVEPLLGYTPEAIRRMGYTGIQTLIHPDDLSGFLAFNAQMLQQPASNTGSHEHLYRVRDHQGDYHWFSDRRTLIRDADGRPAFVIGSQRDITVQKTAEEKRARFYEQFAAVLDSVSAHIYVADINTFEILFINRAMRDAFGDILPGQRCFEHLHAAREVCPDCINDRLLDETGQPMGVHTWESVHPINGHWYLNHDQAIHWVDGRIAHLRIAMDISQIKSIESERQQIAERLRHTRKLEAVSTLAGGVAHNFNNLLMVVLGNLELLRMEVAGDPALVRKIDAAERSATKAADLSSLMLTYVGQTRIRPETVDLNGILDKVVDVLRTTVAEKAHLNIRPLDQEAWINVDVSKVYQVITNLVTNAVEAAGDAPPSIDLSVGVQYCDAVQLARLAPGDDLAEGRYVWLRVSDNGRGMDQETLEKVFDPFFTTKFTGRGLGMAAVMGILRSHRGGVRIDSRPDAGTAVTVYFPEYHRQAPAAKIASEPYTDAPLPYRGTALLVDDEPLVRELGTQMLALMGFDVLTATDGIDALAVFDEHRDRIRLALMDIHMPRMGGPETIDRLLSMGATFPVLVTSGFTEAQARERIGDIHVDGYINKPFRIDQLKEKIEMIFQNGDPNGNGEPGEA
jgi:two-component system cell cycle sensor histidine kinase/response regulator CckA